MPYVFFLLLNSVPKLYFVLPCSFSQSLYVYLKISAEYLDGTTVSLRWLYSNMLSNSTLTIRPLINMFIIAGYYFSQMIPCRSWSQLKLMLASIPAMPPMRWALTLFPLPSH